MAHIGHITETRKLEERVNALKVMLINAECAVDFPLTRYLTIYEGRYVLLLLLFFPSSFHCIHVNYFNCKSTR